MIRSKSFSLRYLRKMASQMESWGSRPSSSFMCLTLLSTQTWTAIANSKCSFMRHISSKMRTWLESKIHLCSSSMMESLVRQRSSRMLVSTPFLMRPFCSMRSWNKSNKRTVLSLLHMMRIWRARTCLVLHLSCHMSALSWIAKLSILM